MSDIADVIGKLEALGSSRQIADFLEEQGVKATMKHANSCAIARYVEGQVGVGVRVGHRSTQLKHPRESTTVTEGETTWHYDYQQAEYLEGSPITDFVADFDAGKYPALVDENYPVVEAL